MDKPNFLISWRLKIIFEFTDLPSRLPTQSSTLYANNITKFLLSIGEKEHYNINFEDEVVRGACILREGEMMWPPPAPKQPVTAPAASKKVEAVKAAPVEPNYFQNTLKGEF